MSTATDSKNSALLPIDEARAENLVLALPKGRILKAIRPILKAAGMEPEDGFFDEHDRRLRFSTKADGVDVIRVRSLTSRPSSPLVPPTWGSPGLMS